MGINVLSLFDGMSCGRIALERVGIKVDNYFSSEIDPYAIKIANKNYPQDEKNRLGNILSVKASDLPVIDLLIGGSPCQGFSFAGKQLNFEDERSKLFFEYVRLLKECKPKYFLLENVRMKKEYQDIISEYLGVEPILINSKVFSPCDRKRLYWTNISVASVPNKTKCLGDIISEGDLEEITDRILLKKEGTLSYKKSWNNIRELNNIARCLTTAGQGISNSGSTNIKINEKYYKPTSLLSEKLQTVPLNYTEGVSETQRHRMLGNGWTVDVIAHIFKGLNSAR